MHLSESIETALNDQLHQRWQASYHFLGISAWFETTPFKGFAKAMLERSEREQRQAMKFFMFLKERLSEIELERIELPSLSFSSPKDAFEQALALKHELTTSSHELYRQAGREKDFHTQEFLHELLQEQIQEEKHMQDHVDKLEVAEDHADALIHLDYKEEQLYKSASQK